MSNDAKNISVDNDAVNLSPREAIELVEHTYLQGVIRTMLMRGSPGIGKTSIAKQAAERLKQAFPDFQIVCIHPTMPPEEFEGIPDLVMGKYGVKQTDYALPVWFPHDPNWRGIILLDDALQGNGSMQKAMAHMIQERELRGHKLPEGAMVIATGNRIQDKAGVAKTLTHFADRMCWINIISDPKTWVEDYAIPKGFEAETVGYIMMDGTKLDLFDPNQEKCPTPRTWEAVNGWVKVVRSYQDVDMRNKIALALYAGELGIGEATRFKAFCDLFGVIPNVDDILRHPSTHTTQYELDVQYALVLAIAQRMNDHTFAAALEYIDRIGPDLTTLAVKIALRKNPALGMSAAFTKWSVKNQDVIHGI